MKKLLLILLCLPMIGLGQGWEKLFGGTNDDYGYSVQQTNDGGYILSGATYSYGSVMDKDVYLVKTDGNGDTTFTKTFGLSNVDERGWSVQQTSDGGYVIAGNRGAFNSGDIFLIKTDGNGTEQWTRTYFNQGVTQAGTGRHVQQTTDGGYIITGYVDTNTMISNIRRPYVIKTDGNGIKQWSKIIRATNYSYTSDWGEGFCVQQTTDGGYIITGYLGQSVLEIFLMKINANGVEQWMRADLEYSFLNINQGFGQYVQQTSDGGYIISGTTISTNFPNPELAIAIKTDTFGIVEWGDYIFATNEANSVQQTTDGGYIFAGYDKVGNSSNVSIVKTDANGTKQWFKSFGNAGNDIAYSIKQTTDGGYIITGVTSSFGNGSYDVYLIKTDGSGNVTSTFNIPINPNRKLEKVFDVLGRETKKTNQPLIYIYDDGTVEKRIVIE